MSRFNLIDEPWLPVRMGDNTRCRMGLRELLLNTRRIAVIEDPSPLVVAALYRFLLALLYRALEGPTDIDKARQLFRTGIPEGPILAYLDKWRERFWLFDATHPFGQIPTFTPKEWKPWTVLAAEHNADNAKVLFDHMAIDQAGTIPEAVATCWLLATQTFAVSCGKSELAHTGTAPSATAVMVLPLGRDLHDTLLFSLVPQSRAVLPQDSALWERDPEGLEALVEGKPRLPAGLADRLTWRTRSIRLFPSPEAEGVAHLAMASGVHCAANDQVDPMLGYRIVEKIGKLPIQFKERGLWRDFDSLLPDGDENAPKSVEHAVALTRSVPNRFPAALLVLGQSNNKAKIEFWRMERFCLPGALAGDKNIRADIRWGLDQAEEAARALWSASSTYARSLLSRGDRSVQAKDVSAFVDQMLPLPLYWTQMESSFHRLLADFTLERPAEAVQREWLGSCRAALQQAWAQHLAMASQGDAWAIRAGVKAEAPVFRKIRELDAQILKLTSQEVS